jgi:hypothetical protein
MLKQQREIAGGGKSVGNADGAFVQAGNAQY